MFHTIRTAAAAVAVILPAAVSADAISYSAVTRPDGFLKSGFGYTNAVPLSEGVVKVDFEADVSSCAYVASIGNFKGRGVLKPGLISVASGGGTSVIVRTTNFGGHPNRRPFHLQVACPDNATRPSHPSVWAVVNGDGTLARGDMALSASKSGTGEYRVDFDSSVSNCTLIATTGDAGGLTAPPGTALAKPGVNGRQIAVDTVNDKGVRTDAGFHLQTVCSDQAGPAFSAVVDKDGNFVRGIGTTGAVHRTTGRYEVDFPQDVSTCSFTASTGDTGLDEALKPGMVDVAGRTGIPNAILVQTFDRKGRKSDRAFHVIVKC